MIVRKYAVTYWRKEADIYDCRTFLTIRELSDWLTKQNELEQTLIVNITYCGEKEIRNRAKI